MGHAKRRPGPKRRRIPAGHSSDVTSIALCAADGGRTAATGQSCSVQHKRPPIRVWDTGSMELRAQLDGLHEVEVACLARRPPPRLPCPLLLSSCKS